MGKILRTEKGALGSEIKLETRGFAYEKMLNNTRQRYRLICKIDFAEKENVILSNPVTFRTTLVMYKVKKRKLKFFTWKPKKCGYLFKLKIIICQSKSKLTKRYDFFSVGSLKRSNCLHLNQEIVLQMTFFAINKSIRMGIK